MSMAQSINRQKALQAYQNDSLAQAVEYIESAIADEIEGVHPYTWHVRGFIYKGVFQKTDDENPDSKARAEAIMSFNKSMELDTIEEFKDNNKSAIRYFASTYYNDGVKSFDIPDVEKALGFLEKHNLTMRMVQPNYYSKDRELQMYKQAGLVYMKIFEKDKIENDAYFQKAIDKYETAITLDSNDFNSLLNCGVLYHNRGVDVLLNASGELSLEDILALDELHINLMEKSKNFMRRAYNINPNHPGVIRALAGIYYSIHNQEQYEFFNKKLLTLEEKSKGQQNPDNSND